MILISILELFLIAILLGRINMCIPVINSSPLPRGVWYDKMVSMDRMDRCCNRLLILCRRLGNDSEALCADCLELGPESAGQLRQPSRGRDVGRCHQHDTRRWNCGFAYSNCLAPQIADTSQSSHLRYVWSGLRVSN